MTASPRRLKRRTCPDKWQGVHRQMYDIVQGAVIDAFTAHPDYLTDAGRHAAAQSVAKRVTGQIVGVIKEAQKRRVETPSRANPSYLDGGKCVAYAHDGNSAAHNAEGGAVLNGLRPKSKGHV